MNKHIIQKIEPLVYNGQSIDMRSDRMSLTSMFKAAGSPPNQDPAQWQRSAAAEAFIDAVSINMGISHNNLVESRKRGGTWAHWQVAFAYAKYLSPEFHMWCNQVVRERMEGKALATATTLTEYDKQILGNMIKNCTGVVIKEQIGQLLPAMLDTMVAARLAEHSYLLRRGKTAGQIWREYGFPPIRVTSWFSNRLVKMGCQIDGGGRGELGLGTAKLFDPDKADLWLRNGGKALVEQYIQERQGQKIMKFKHGAKLHHEGFHVVKGGA